MVAFATSSLGFEICRDPDPVGWDEALVTIPGGHALQTWEWGEAKRSVGETVERFLISRAGNPVLLAQVFQKRVSALKLKTAWIPRGPVISPSLHATAAVKLFKGALAADGYRLAIAKPYQRSGVGFGWSVPCKHELTFVLDLSQPLSVLEGNLDRGWRHGRNKFGRQGGIVVEDTAYDAIEPIIRMYAAMGERKKFNPYGDAELTRAMWHEFRNSKAPSVSTHLLRAEVNGRWAGGMLVVRLGKSAYPMRFGFDYELRNTRVSEGLFWDAIRRMHELGADYFDLEGVNPKKNPGVYEFKRKMGGTLVKLPRFEVTVPTGSLASQAARQRRKEAR